MPVFLRHSGVPGSSAIYGGHVWCVESVCLRFGVSRIILREKEGGREGGMQAIIIPHLPRRNKNPFLLCPVVAQNLTSTGKTATKKALLKDERSVSETMRVDSGRFGLESEPFR